MGEGSLATFKPAPHCHSPPQSPLQDEGTHVLALCGPKSPSSPHPGLPQAQSNSKAPSSPQVPRGRLSAHSQVPDRPGPGPVPPLTPASSHFLRPPFQSHHGHLLRVRPGRSQAHLRLDASLLLWGSGPEMLGWQLRKAARKQVTSGRLCGNQQTDREDVPGRGTTPHKAQGLDRRAEEQRQHKGWLEGSAWQEGWAGAPRASGAFLRIGSLLLQDLGSPQKLLRGVT